MGSSCINFPVGINCHLNYNIVVNNFMFVLCICMYICIIYEHIYEYNWCGVLGRNTIFILLKLEKLKDQLLAYFVGSWHFVWLVLGLGTHIYLITPNVCRFSSFLCIAFVSFLFSFFFYLLYFLAALCFSCIK